VLIDSGRPDGARSADGQILGTYLHGIFDAPSACVALMGWLGVTKPIPQDYASLRELAIERVADAVETHLDLRRLFAMIGIAA
jgi:adenosylcobyric acid synthase